MVILSEWFSLLGQGAIIAALVVMGWLSRRMGEVTRAPRFYRGFYLSGMLLAISLGARVVYLIQGRTPAELHEDMLAVLLITGLPALAITLGVVIAWRYWSWLLAERG
ncbi:MAG: hypothetical protein JNM70_20950 [Anaerolineae bacterium]|nr:hypothetical protein [Anaerolineae bacterium]